MADGDRHSIAETATLLTDPDEIARREAENGIKQFNRALDIVRTHVKDSERPFRLRSSTILQLHKEALDGLHPLAGTWRNTSVKIGGSGHQPPESAFVSEEIEAMCSYVNDHWLSANALHFGCIRLMEAKLDSSVFGWQRQNSPRRLLRRAKRKIG